MAEDAEELRRFRDRFRLTLLERLVLKTAFAMPLTVLHAGKVQTK